MAVVNPPLYLNLDGEYAARHLGYPWRFALSEGVTTTGGLAVSQNGTPNMSVNVAAGKAFVLGDDSDQQPLYLVTNDGTVNLAIAAADPTNPRKDIVIFEVRDSQFSGVNDDSQLRVVTGTPAGSPAEPALPNNAIKLAVIDVPANDTQITDSQITDTRPFAQPGGELGITGKLPLYGTVANRPPAAAGNESQLYYATDEDRLYVSNGSAWRTVWPTIDVVTSGTRPGSPFDGQVIYETDTDFILTWNGSEWVLPLNVPRGEITSASRNSGGATITSEAQLGTSFSFTALANRLYGFGILGTVGSAGGNTGKFLCRVKVDGSVVAAAYSGLCPSTGAARPLAVANVVGGLASGSRTVTVTGERLEGSGIGDMSVTIRIFDAGPSA